MPSFDLSYGDVVIIAVTLVLVVLPSRLAWMGNVLGRLLSRKR